MDSWMDSWVTWLVGLVGRMEWMDNWMVWLVGWIGWIAGWVGWLLDGWMAG